MAYSPEIKAWYQKLTAQLIPIGETQQRIILFRDMILDLEPAVASQALSHLLGAAFCIRSRAALITAEAALLAIAQDLWPNRHRRETYRASTANDERLTSIFLRHTPPKPHQAESAENALPVPLYNPSRPLTLGERRSLAAKPDRSLIERALLDPHPKVITKLLDNPKLTEDDVVHISTRRPAAPEVLKVVSLHQRWRPNKRIARALLYNPATPTQAALTLLPGLDKQTVSKIAKDTHLDGLLREAAARFLQLQATKMETFHR